MLVRDPGVGGGGWGHVPPPPQEAVSVLKIFAHYMYGNGLVEVWGVSMDRTTVIITDQSRKRVCLAL